MKPANDLEWQANQKAHNTEHSEEARVPSKRARTTGYFKTFVVAAAAYWLLSSVLETALDHYLTYRTEDVISDQAMLESALWALGLPKGSDWDEKIAKTEKLFLYVHFRYPLYSTKCRCTYVQVNSRC